LGKDQHAHQGVDDGGDADQGLGGELDGGHQLVVGGVLRQVDGGAHAQGQHHDEGGNDDINGIHNGGADALDITDHALLRGQELRGEVGQSPVQDIAQQENEQGHHDGGGDIDEGAHARVVGPAA